MKKTNTQELSKNLTGQDENLSEMLRAWGLLVRRFANAYRQVFIHCKMAKGPAEILLYLKMENNNVEPSVIADFMNMPRQTMTSILDGLQRQDFVVRKPHPSDRRKILITLSKKGANFADSVLGSIRSIEEEAMRKLSYDDLSRMLSLMGTFSDAMEESIAAKIETEIV